ncbi:MAG: hypothetical protein QM757_27150 [Paludibaculum sp.]
MKSAILLLATAATLSAQIDRIQGERIRPHVKFLSSDLLEGRGVGARGGQLAAEYIAAQFAAAGLKPGGENGTYFQRVPLRSVEVEPGGSLTATAGGKSISFKWLDDFVATSHTQESTGQFDAEAVFVGHGIVAPEYQWDDYKGVDVKGKVVVLFTNEPPSTDANFFKGKALTYYGRWTYKYEEAARQGAVAAIIIHTTPTASYGWQVLRANGRAHLRSVAPPGNPPSPSPPGSPPMPEPSFSAWPARPSTRCSRRPTSAASKPCPLVRSAWRASSTSSSRTSRR